MPGGLPLFMLQNTTPQKLGPVPLVLMICLCIGVCGIASAEAGTLNTPDPNPFGTAGQDHDACVQQCQDGYHNCQIINENFGKIVPIACDGLLPNCLSRCTPCA
jgi:hypothetical protein